MSNIFLDRAKLIISGLSRGMYDERSVADYLYKSYLLGYGDGLEDGKPPSDLPPKPYSAKGVF